MIVNRKQRITIFQFFFILFVLIHSSYSQTTQTSVYYKNFVRHSEGEFCEHQPPATTFAVYLNNNQGKILVENAPRWRTGMDPNIPGTGVFGVELGNFSNPPLAIGDTVSIRFSCNESHEQGVLTAVVSGIPWYYFPATLSLTPVNMPSPPTGLSLTVSSNGQRILQWNEQSGVSYSVYRRDAADTVALGQSRMQYFRLAENVVGGSFTDASTSAEAHGYIVIPKRGNVYGSHSVEVTDFPGIPEGLEAAVASSNPLTVAVTWRQPGDTTGLRYRIYRSRSAGLSVDSTKLIGSTASWHFIDSLVTQGETYYYKVVAVNEIGIPGLPSDEVSVSAVPFANGYPDLDILHISRSPKYPRFEVEYTASGYNPHPRPGTENQKHYPDPGEMMTYTATVRNSGGGTMDGFRLFWYVDSQIVQTEDYGALFPRQRIFSRLQWPWSDSPVNIKCEVQPLQTTNEVTANNNSLQIRSNALSFHFYAEENILELFGTHLNPMDSYSFEDWAQVHVGKLNRFFAEAVYPGFAPQGVPEAVFLDTVDYHANGTLPAGGTHAPESILWDGQWGFTGDANAMNYFLNIVLNQQNGMDWALLHELGHQLGLIDLYNMDVQQSEFQVIDPRTGQTPPLTPIAWDVLFYCSRSPHLMHSNYQAGLSDHSAGGLLRNLSKRRGYFGDYLADIPHENTLELRYPDGIPVRNAELWVYQMQDNSIPDIPKFRGRTDSQGSYIFPHTTDSLYSGGIAVENPFSSTFSPAPHVVGTNSVLFIRAAKDDSVGYRFMDVCEFNVAYWSGDSLAAAYPVTISEWFAMPASGVGGILNNVPQHYALNQNFPNPFNPVTRIAYQLPEQCDIDLMIYNTLGQAVRRLVSKRQMPGIYEVVWDGKNDLGAAVSSGIYFYRIESENFNSIRKMILLR